MSGIRVYVDYRERKLIRIFAEFAAITEVVPLPIGDVVIATGGGCTLVERKSAHDLIDSIADNRLWNQMHRMASTEEMLGTRVLRRLLVVDGDVEEQVDMGRMVWSQLFGVLQEVTFAYGVPVFLVGDELREFMRTLYLREETGKNDREGEFRLRRIAPHSPGEEDWKVYVLSSIPGVGDRLAKNLLKHFGSIENIARASVDDLMRVEGIGRKKAEWIRKIFT